MGTILISLALGLLTGRLLRQLQWKLLLSKLGEIFLPTLTLMVFFLALSVASREAKLFQLGDVLFNAILLALSSMLGSILLAAVIQRWLCRRIQRATVPLQRYFMLERRRNNFAEALDIPKDGFALKAGIYITSAFALGLLVSLLNLPIITHTELVVIGKNLTLQMVMVLVGINLGSDRRTLRLLKSAGPCILILPLAIIVGTLLGAITISCFLPSITWIQAMSIGSGLGFYSASSSIISNLAGPVLGLTALIVNLLREILTLILGPHLAKFFGPVGPIACGGATTMNSTLPMISIASGKDYVVLAFCSGLILSLLVPVLVTVILQIP